MEVWEIFLDKSQNDTYTKLAWFQIWPFWFIYFPFNRVVLVRLYNFILPVSWENGNQLSLDIIFNNWKWKFQTKFICISHIKMEFMEFVKFIFNSIDKKRTQEWKKNFKMFTCNRYSSLQMGSPNKKEKKGNNRTTH